MSGEPDRGGPYSEGTFLDEKGQEKCLDFTQYPVFRFQERTLLDCEPETPPLGAHPYSGDVHPLG